LKKQKSSANVVPRLRKYLVRYFFVTEGSLCYTKTQKDREINKKHKVLVALSNIRGFYPSSNKVEIVDTNGNHFILKSSGEEIQRWVPVLESLFTHPSSPSSRSDPAILPFMEAPASTPRYLGFSPLHTASTPNFSVVLSEDDPNPLSALPFGTPKFIRQTPNGTRSLSQLPRSTTSLSDDDLIDDVEDDGSSSPDEAYCPTHATASLNSSLNLSWDDWDQIFNKFQEPAVLSHSVGASHSL